jgi:tetratricopeptide (TPR) repeat protein
MRINSLLENENRLGGVIFLVSFFVYAATLCPTVYTGDSGELITACYTMGVAHPPGYPLYCLLGRFFTLIPLGSIAWRVNLFSAFCASLTVAFVYLIIVELIRRIKPDSSLEQRFIPGLCGSLILAFSRTFWSQAVIAEVYTLYTCMIALTFLVLLRWSREKRIRLLYWFSFLYGLTIVCHQLGLFFWLGFLLLIILYEPAVFTRPKTLFLLVCFFLLGLSLYLYVLLRSRIAAPFTWGWVRDFKDLVNFILRKDYLGVRPNYSLGDVFFFYKIEFSRLKGLGSFLTQEFTLLWMLGIAGFIPLALRGRRLLAVVFVIFLLAVARAWMPITADAQTLYIGRVYLLGGYISIAILLGLAVFYLTRLSLRYARRPFLNILQLAFALLPLILLVSYLRVNDQSHNYLAYLYGQDILASIDKDAILFAEGDNRLFILAYLTLAEKQRPDVSIYDNLGGRIFKSTPFDLTGLSNEQKEALISALLKKTARPIYLDSTYALYEPKRYRLKQEGLVYRVLGENSKIPQKDTDLLWLGYHLEDMFKSGLTNKEFLMRRIIAEYYLALGKHLLAKNKTAAGFSYFEQAAETLAEDKRIYLYLGVRRALAGRFEAASAGFEKAIKIDPRDPEVYYNFGVAYAQVGKYDAAIEQWSKALVLQPGFRDTQQYIDRAKELLQREQ